ncbi:hypothetical protein HL658_02100 [Azospirillum sp. RWY-5-1]|uniref:Alpha/beta hydrolase n=1 Tax=Azospirillum oleiclasticum TaxID=2735135 RepID=A0ABX2T3S7_9PROT|nr:hypothetical protein [Azospirillum oleiclasticum]NYZ11329.1 hypothetical protein [Azospirillum oleiclasticum]NYZ18490.1 hypothetical protein [Azospirillum oleiclasticum]
MSDIPEWVHTLNKPPEYAFDVLKDPASSPERRLAACQLLMRLGIIRWTMEHLESLRSHPELTVRVEQLLAIGWELWDTDLTQGNPVPAIPLETCPVGDVWIVPAGSHRTVLVFPGRYAHMWVSVYLMQRLLEPHGVNVIHVFDALDAFHLGGIGGMGNSLEAAQHILRRLAANIGTRQLYCFGQSSGGYAALRYGLDMGATAVLAFSPMVFQPRRPRWLAHIHAKTGRRFGPDDIDLRPLYRRYEEEGRSPPRTTIFCGANNEADMRSAAELTDFVGVKHFTLNGISAHDITPNLLHARLFHPILTRFFEDPAES